MYPIIHPNPQHVGIIIFARVNFQQIWTSQDLDVCVKFNSNFLVRGHCLVKTA